MNIERCPQRGSDKSFLCEHLVCGGNLQVRSLCGLMRSSFRIGEFLVSDYRFPCCGLVRSNTCLTTDRDELFIDNSKQQLSKRINILLSGRYDEGFKNKYRIIDSSSYKITSRLRGKQFNSALIKQIYYRPFDLKWIYYDETLISRPIYSTFKYMLKDNIALGHL